MTKRERIKATLAGEPVDRVPVAFWRHWPVDDQYAEALASRALEYQAQYDWDFIKVTPSSTYCVDDWGAKHVYRGRDIGEREYVERVVKRPEDWDRIEPVDIRKGSYGRVLETLRIVLGKRAPETPVIQTVFNPSSIARYLAGDETYTVHLREHPERMERALRAITETTSSFVAAAIGEGADGIFLSTRASYEAMSEDENRRFVRPYDLRVLESARGGWFNVMHLHGQYPMFREIADYPVQAVNWHDRTAWPPLEEAAKLFPGALSGGVEQYALLHFGTHEEVTGQVHDAIARMGGRRLIISAGCTYQLTVPVGNLLAARHAVETAP
ncbi:MAG TPA: uroporphyrinogen decarboxylase family protein, partial [Chloroflexota bacterium]